jgi:aspartyl-tRNA(Asn)/glutamyl-tRNA(Gln) amidotransferase subunit C
MSEITPDVVRHLAGLSRIALTDDEITKLTGELGAIVDSVAKVNEVAHHIGGYFRHATP